MFRIQRFAFLGFVSLVAAAVLVMLPAHQPLRSNVPLPGRWEEVARITASHPIRPAEMTLQHRTWPTKALNSNRHPPMAAAQRPSPPRQRRSAALPRQQDWARPPSALTP